MTLCDKHTAGKTPPPPHPRRRGNRANEHDFRPGSTICRLRGCGWVFDFSEVERLLDSSNYLSRVIVRAFLGAWLSQMLVTAAIFFYCLRYCCSYYHYTGSTQLLTLACLLVQHQLLKNSFNSPWVRISS